MPTRAEPPPASVSSPPAGVAAPKDPGPKWPGFDARPLILVALLVLLSGLLAAMAVLYQRTRALAEGERLTAAFAVVVDEQTTRTIQALEQHMDLIALTVAGRSAADTPTRASASALLGRHLDALPFVQSFAVLDAQGQIRFSSATASAEGQLEPEQLQRLQSRPATDLWLDAPRREGGQEPWLLRTARPILHNDGTLAGAVLATVRAAYFDALWRSLALESGSALSLLRSDGTMLLRSPLNDAAMGRNFSNGPLMRQHLPASTSGGFRVNSPVDGTPRLIAYRTLASHPELVVVVGRSVNAVLAPWRQLTGLVLGGWALASLALTAVVMYLGRVAALRSGAEQRAVQLAQRLAIASEAAGIVLWDWALSTDAWNVTPSYYTTLGLETQDGPVHYDTWLARVHPDDQTLFAKTLESIQSVSNNRYVCEIRVRHADGSYRWMQEIGQVQHRSPLDRPERLLGVRIDVTDRKLRELEHDQLLERISDGFMALDTDWRFTYVNAQAGQLLNRDPGSLVGRLIWEELRPLPDEQFPMVCRQALADQMPVRLEAYYPDMGRWIEDHIYPSPGGISILFRDVSQRKADEIALRQAKDQAESLIANANLMIVGLDASGQITLFNQAAQNLTGYSLLDLAGRNWFDVLCPRARYPDVWDQFAQVADGALPRAFENPILTRTGEERIIAWQNNVLKEGGTMTGCLSFGIDVTARRQAEQALAESRDQFEILAHNSLQAIVLIRKGQLVYTNPAFHAIAARSSEELSHFSLAQLMQWVHPDDRATSVERQRRTMQGEVVSDLNELRVQMPDGQWRWILSSMRKIVLGGEPALLAMMLDIHERKTSEEALRSSEARFRSAFESSAIGMSLSTRDGRWLMVNPALCRIVGYSEAELLTLGYVNLTHPDDIAQDLQLTEELFAAKRASFQMEKRYLHKDGHAVWINLTIAAVHDVQGTVTHTVAQIEDIGPRKALEHDLRASETLMRQMAESVSQMFWLIDMLENRYLYISPAVESVLGCRAEDLLNDSRCWRRSIHPQDKAWVEALLSTAPQTGQYDMQLRLLHPDGSLHWIHARAYPIWDDAGTLYRCAGVIEDITARKSAEVALRDSQQQLRVLSAKVLAAQETERRRVAHELHDELGQALTAIKINLQTDARMAPHSDGGLLAENLRIVESALQQVRGLALALRPSMLDDLGLLPALRWLTEQSAGRNALQVRLHTPATLARLAPDLETAVFRIVQEALTNVARHAQASQVDITVELPEPDTLQVQVRDNGVGFDVDAMRQHATQGNSMGVLGMQERASLVGAELTIASNPGDGCTVTLRCPLQPASSSPGPSNGD